MVPQDSCPKAADLTTAIRFRVWGTAGRPVGSVEGWASCRRARWQGTIWGRHGRDRLGWLRLGGLGLGTAGGRLEGLGIPGATMSTYWEDNNLSKIEITHRAF